jgi:Mn-dependent DtxR family transcriptional regulator
VSTRQEDCLHEIRAWIAANGKSPTRSELGRRLGITKVSAHQLVAKLERAGMVVTHPGVWRNIEVTAEGSIIGAA